MLDQQSRSIKERMEHAMSDVKRATSEHNPHILIN
jgi:hypothetical protein